MHVKVIQALKKAQLLAGNTLNIDSIEELEELLTLLDTLHIYNVWIAPATIAVQLWEFLFDASNCLKIIVHV